MTTPKPDEKYNKELIELFQSELETYISSISDAVLYLEQHPQDQQKLQSILQTVHSIKGAARIVNLDRVVQLTHAIEENLQPVREKKIDFSSTHADLMLKAMDLLSTILHISEGDIDQKITEQDAQFNDLIAKFLGEYQENVAIESKHEVESIHPTDKKTIESQSIYDKSLRVTTDKLNQLRGLTGEVLLQSSWVQPFNNQLQILKKLQNAVETDIEKCSKELETHGFTPYVKQELEEIKIKIKECRKNLAMRISESENFNIRLSSLTERLTGEMIEVRMRPFSDLMHSFSRMVRDLAKELGKKVSLKIEGISTLVDREILDKLEAPLTHIIRNAIDHGIESPKERKDKGKEEEGTITVIAKEFEGRLHITVEDDGKGIDLDALRNILYSKRVSTEELISHLSEKELLDFLFLEGFTTAKNVTEISGRGLGLTAAQAGLHDIRGTIYATTKKDEGAVFHLELPITLAVTRALIVEIAGEFYALPLSRIEKVFNISKNSVKTFENIPFVFHSGINIGLVYAADIFGFHHDKDHNEDLSIVVLSDRSNLYGVIVDKFLGEKDLVLHEIDPRLGKIQDISALSILDNGDLLLVIDPDDMVHSIVQLSSGQQKKLITQIGSTDKLNLKKCILVIDDSLTVREVQSRILHTHGYKVDTAVDGIDGWNAIRSNKYDLVITDVDMPRMNGIDLLKKIRKTEKFRKLPVIIVSYKHQEEDRIKGMAAGANDYLSKSSFGDSLFLDTVSKYLRSSESDG
jgi:two-component system sensor histidine kinase and response regulator WspE